MVLSFFAGKRLDNMPWCRAGKTIHDGAIYSAAFDMMILVVERVIATGKSIKYHIMLFTKKVTVQFGKFESPQYPPEFTSDFLHCFLKTINGYCRPFSLQFFYQKIFHQSCDNLMLYLVFVKVYERNNCIWLSIILLIFQYTIGVFILVNSQMSAAEITSEITPCLHEYINHDIVQALVVFIFISDLTAIIVSIWVYWNFK
jgi:hypothetical protein